MPVACEPNLVAKTPVSRIHLFDDDVLDHHDAFRAPGAASLDDLRFGRAKVDHLAAVHPSMHGGIVPDRVRLGRANAGLLDGIGFAFVSGDHDPPHRTVVEALEARDASLVDVGMGIEATPDGVSSPVRVTTTTPDMRDHERRHRRIPHLSGSACNPDLNNVSVVDLNELDGALAATRWERLRGYHRDEDDCRHCAHVRDANALLDADEPTRAGSGIRHDPRRRSVPDRRPSRNGACETDAWACRIGGRRCRASAAKSWRAGLRIRSETDGADRDVRGPAES